MRAARTSWHARASRVRNLALALLLVLATQAGAAPQVAPPTPFPWPNGARAAISLAYDDAIDSQLDVAAPALARHGLKGSFYLTLSSPTLARRLPEWRALAAAGHELGNHTLFHQCSRKPAGREWVTPENDLDTTPAAALVAQVRVGNTMLHALDGRQARTFTAPCGDRLAAGTDYLPLLAADFVAIKVGDGGVVPDMAALDLHAVGVTVPVDATGAELIALAEAAAARGTMLNLTFHGIGGDYLAVPAEAHEQLLAHLAAHPERFWTATFLDIATHVRAVRAQAASAGAAPAR
jgi:peptidoglycan/xylan/chitin deacetylase (PgdA/CDA1 family)